MRATSRLPWDIYLESPSPVHSVASREEGVSLEQIPRVPSNGLVFSSPLPWPTDSGSAAVRWLGDVELPSHLASFARMVGNVDLTFLPVFLLLQSTLWDLRILNSWQPLAMWTLWVFEETEVGGGVWDSRPSEWAPGNQMEGFILGESNILRVGKILKSRGFWVFFPFSL